MKALKYFGIGLLIFAVLFFIIGLIKPSVSYGHEIKVKKPVEEAWAVTQDASKYAQWLKGFKSIELIEGEQSKVGSKYKVVVLPAEGQDEFEMTQTLKSIKEFDHVTLVFDSDFMDFEQTISFSESGGETTVKSDSKVMGRGLMTKSMFALMEMIGGSFTKQEAENFDALKVLIEENTTDYYPPPPPPRMPVGEDEND